MGLTFGGPRGLWEIETPFLKSARKISHTQGEILNWKVPGSDLPASLREVSGEARGNWSSPRGHRQWWESFGGAYITIWTLVLASDISEPSFQLNSLRTQPHPCILAWSHPYWDASCVLVAQLCPTLCYPRTVARQTPLSMEVIRQEYWSV